MLTLIEAHNYRCLRYIRQELGPLHILVGPNASGKTTFLDVVTFLGDLVSKGLDEALQERTQNPHDLLWKQQGTSFELAIEARIPEMQAEIVSTGRNKYETVRYEVSIGIDGSASEPSILAEKVLLQPPKDKTPNRQHVLFPDPVSQPPGNSILTPKGQRFSRPVLNKVHGGNDNYYPETYKDKGKGWMPAFRFGSRRSALGNLPADETKFPVASWLKNLLTEGVQPFILNSLLIRKASPPGLGRRFRPDGSNLPWVIDELSSKNDEHYKDWIAHLQTALPDLSGIRTVERPDDRHRYIMLKYQGNDGEFLEIPSWVASDGTLRLLALTLPAYLPGMQGILLIEEPENGIHPRAVETLFQSLSSVYDAQVLLATHSPVILGLAQASQILCFAKTQEGATDIILGSDHPALRDWRGETNLGVLFAGGVLS